MAFGRFCISNYINLTVFVQVDQPCFGLDCISGSYQWICGELAYFIADIDRIPRGLNLINYFARGI